MTSEFEYFFWASPAEGQPLFALYDAFDNHMMIQSYDHACLFAVRKLIRSKTILDIVELTNIPNLVSNNLIDNSVIENWGLESVHNDLFRDATPRWKNQHDSAIFYKTATVKDPVLQAVESKFDNFKHNLQQQIFFIYYCLENNPTDNVKAHLQQAVELGTDYADTVDRFLNFTNITDKTVLQDMIAFLRTTGLFYE
jgi:hypothetical protein